MIDTVKAQIQVRIYYCTYLEDIVTPDSNGDTHTANKRFWRFIKHKRQDMTGIPNLLDDNGMEYTTPLTKAHALNQQFPSVFSNVTPTTLKDTASRLLPPSYNPMDCITITTAGINKLLCKLGKHLDQTISVLVFSKSCTSPSPPLYRQYTRDPTMRRLSLTTGYMLMCVRFTRSEQGMPQ